MKRILNYFSRGELCLWALSSLFIVAAFLAFDRERYLTLVNSLIGVTSLIFNAKGNPLGQLMMVLFSLLYGLISLGCAYYGEMITYLGMTMPMAIFSFAAWLKNPFKGRRSEVAVNRIGGREVLLMPVLTAAVTAVFFFILRALGTASLALSTASVATSFLAVYLTFRRSEHYALAYAANDLVLIGLWVIAARENAAYVSVVICFAAFLVNDVYGFISWRRMYRRQCAELL